MTVDRMRRTLSNCLGVSAVALLPGCVIVVGGEDVEGDTVSSLSDESGTAETGWGDDEATGTAETGWGDDEATATSTATRGEDTWVGETEEDTWVGETEEEDTGIFDTGEEGYETGETEESEESGETEESESSESESSESESESESSESETGGCEDEPHIVDPRRSLIETSVEALDGVTMSELLTQAALHADMVPNASFTHTRLFDSFATAEGGVDPSGIHCDDEFVDGVPSLNGYPIRCPRIESEQVQHIDDWFPIAYVNRFDLMSSDGSDCGEQRIIMANSSNNRAFVIFESRIPNPEPECGVAACLPIAEFWEDLSSMDDPTQRGAELRAAFIDGHPDLEAAGFEPFISAVNLTAGSGQIRTNSFDDSPWTLRQFKFVQELPGPRLSVMEVPVTDNSQAAVWNDLSDHPAGLACRASILANLGDLLVDDTASMGMTLASICNTAESPDNGHSRYADAMQSGSGDFEAALAQRLVDLGSDLTTVELANRATFATNCIGCHQAGTGLELGHGLSAPFSSGFVHVDEFFFDSCDGDQCFSISPALRDDFLPTRQGVLEDFLGQFSCEEVCEQDNPEAINALFEGPVTNGLPDARTPVSELIAWERNFAAGLSKRTVGGRPRSGH